MIDDENKTPLPDDGDNDDEDSDLENERAALEALRDDVTKIQKKLTGESSEKVTVRDVAQYTRAINYNFGALSALLVRVTKTLDGLLVIQDNVEKRLEEIQTKLSAFSAIDTMVDQVLTEESSDESDNSKT